MTLRITALAACAGAGVLALTGVVGAANPGNRAFVAKPSGANEVPAATTKASGTALIRVNSKKRTVCWVIHVKNLSATATAAHIHPGVAGATGAPVLTLSTPNGGKKNAKSAGCTTLPAGSTLISQILANPRAFYVNVHTSNFPNGEVRGQLKRA